ncbi:transposase, partial [Geobacillus stearothermophilus]
MYRTVKIPFQTSKKDIDRLFECNRISAQIWNDCLVIAK